MSTTHVVSLFHRLTKVSKGKSAMFPGKWNSYYLVRRARFKMSQLLKIINVYLWDSIGPELSAWRGGNQYKVLGPGSMECPRPGLLSRASISVVATWCRRGQDKGVCAGPSTHCLTRAEQPSCLLVVQATWLRVEQSWLLAHLLLCPLAHSAFAQGGEGGGQA